MIVALMYILIIVAWECLVIMYGCLFNVFPGRWYRWHIINVQIFLSSLTFTLGVSSRLLAVINDEIFKERTAFTGDLQGPILFVNALLFSCSVIRFWEYKKRKEEVQVLRIYKDDYKIVKELDDGIGNSVETTNVSTIAILDTSIIIFPGAHPDEAVDADFVCRKIGDNVYECLSYVALERHISLRSIINGAETALLMGWNFLLPVLLVYIDYADRMGKEVDLEICGPAIIYTLGAATRKLLRGEDGLFARFFYLFGCFFEVTSFIALFQLMTGR